MSNAHVWLNGKELGSRPYGKSLGRKKRFGDPVELPVGANVSADKKFVSKYRLTWQVPYEPGTLRAVSYQGGKQTAADEVRTAGAPVRIMLIPDRTTPQSSDDDLSFVTVRIEDKGGNVCPAADNLVKFQVTGERSCTIDCRYARRKSR